MIETITKCLSANFIPRKDEKYNGCVAMIGIISGMGVTQLFDKLFLGFASPGKY